MTLYDLVDRPSLEQPVLVVSLEGWIDAGLGAELARDALLAGLTDRSLVATFDTDALLDYRARRPIMHLDDGVNRHLTWSSIELHRGRDMVGNDVLVLTGVEPDHAWKAFARQVTELSVSFGVRMMCGLGAYPAAVPHTRPTLLSVTSPNEQLAASTGLIRGSIDVPAGIEAVVEHELHAAGIQALGIWAQVPHYAAAMRYPAASLGLLETLASIAGIDAGRGELADEATETRDRIDALIADNAENQAMIRQLEEHADQFRAAGGERLPSGDELAAELQRYLRDQGEG